MNQWVLLTYFDHPEAISVIFLVFEILLSVVALLCISHVLGLNYGVSVLLET